jgi:hypothetical protein
LGAGAEENVGRKEQRGERNYIMEFHNMKSSPVVKGAIK